MNVRARHAVLPCALSALLSWTPSLQAQNRFDLLCRGGIAQMPDVSIDTSRDRRTASCFAVFSAGQGPSSAPPVGTAGWIVPRIVDEPQAARPPRDEPPDPQAWATLPWSTATPGLPTGGWEHLAESLRRALVEPATARALSAPLRDALVSLDDRLRHIELLLQQIGSSRTFAVWPVSCDTAGNR